MDEAGMDDAGMDEAGVAWSGSAVAIAHTGAAWVGQGLGGLSVDSVSRARDWLSRPLVHATIMLGMTSTHAAKPTTPPVRRIDSGTMRMTLLHSGRSRAAVRLPRSASSFDAERPPMFTPFRVDYRI
jgi:hypothetical protein